MKLYYVGLYDPWNNLRKTSAFSEFSALNNLSNNSEYKYRINSYDSIKPMNETQWLNRKSLIKTISNSEGSNGDFGANCLSGLWPASTRPLETSIWNHCNVIGVNKLNREESNSGGFHTDNWKTLYRQTKVLRFLFSWQWRKLLFMYM